MYVFVFFMLVPIMHEVCLTYPGLGIDVCPSIQEELQGREMAADSSIVEGGLIVALMKTKIR